MKPLLLNVFGAIALAFLGLPHLFSGEMKGRSWMLLRALFPSWRFFEDLQWIPKLWFQVIRADGSADEWKECFLSEARGTGTLFLNPRGNLRMACQSLLEQFSSDLADLPEGEESRLPSLVSYELVANLVRFRIREISAGKPGDHFQFKILSALPGANEKNTDEEMMISAIHEVSPR